MAVLFASTFAVVAPGEDEIFDFVPPATDRAPESVRLGLRGDADEFLEPVLCRGGVFG